jgi:hypothetical protein
MTTPAFFNAGSVSFVSGVTTVTPGVPAQTTNDLLVSYCFVHTSTTITTATSGWTVGGQVSANESGAWAWALAGSTAAPVWTWTGSANAASQVLQFNNNLTSSPTGAQQSTTANAATTINIAGVTTTVANSLIYIPGGGGGNFVFSQPQTNTYASLGTGNNAFGSVINLTGQVNQSGVASETCTLNAPSTQDMAAFQIEIKGSGAATGSHSRATQLTKQALYLDGKVTNTRATQLTMQVLRTQAAFTPLPPHSFGSIVV